MSQYVIKGGQQLKGEVKVSGSKNAALPIITASVLIPEAKLTNVPRIKDVEVMLEILQYLGGKYKWRGEHELYLNSQSIQSKPLDELARKLRASIAFAGPLLARFGQAELPYPGGDIIGARPLDTHINSFRELGAEVEVGQVLRLTMAKHQGASFILDEPSVLGTENVIMYAAGISAPVEIRLAATEPHVQDLCNFLVAAGVDIKGIGTTTLKIKGSPKLNSVEYSIIPDDTEVSSFAALAAATHGDVVITSVDLNSLDSVLLQLRKMNVNFEVGENSLHILPPVAAYKAHRLQSGLYPKLLTDHLPPFAVLATQAEGATLVHDWLFEARQSYIRELIKMGANAIIMDPHRALIIGPTPLYGKEVTSFDIRSGMAMIIAALVAEGKTVITEVKHVDRGYENLEQRLKALGADIVREE